MAESTEAKRVLNYLAAVPSGSTTVAKEVLQEMLLSTSGWIFAQGEAYNIRGTDIGADIFEVRLEPRY